MENIKKEFFKTFAIEPECHNPIVKLSKDKKCEGICKNCEQYNYPDITAEKLLKLICIWNNYTNCADELIIPMDFESLKEKVLERLVTPTLYDCDIDDEWFEQQVQALFKGGE